MQQPPWDPTAGYPQATAYPQAAAGQPVYPQQAVYPQQPVYPQQAGVPQYPQAYPSQPVHPQQPYPHAHPAGQGGYPQAVPAQPVATPVQGRPIPVAAAAGAAPLVSNGVVSTAARPVPVGPGTAGPTKRMQPAAKQSAKPAATNDDENADDEDKLEAPRLVKAAPPWLVSFVVHLVAMIVLALITLPIILQADREVEVIIAEEIGEQLETPDVVMAGEDQEIQEQIITPEDLPPVDDPLAAPPDASELFQGHNPTDPRDAPQVGLALAGREAGMKRALLLAYGGDATTEEAVNRALRWLAKNQMKDGGWSLTGPYSGGSTSENRLAATSMALLAFQGAGHTYHVGEFKDQVKRGWDYLLPQMNADGDFWKPGPPSHHRLYSQAQATIALAELYGMTKDERFRGPAQKAIDYAIKIQSPEGGWRYNPGSDSDTSVTGWFVMALQSGRMAGLEVPSPNLDRLSKFLDTVASDNGTKYSYLPGQAATVPMTSEALLARQYLGWKQDDQRLIAGCDFISSQPMKWNDQNVYHWYYATQTLHHMEGDYWYDWNSVMRKLLPEKQVKTGAEAGSWDAGRDRWGGHGGRLYTTCLCTYMLEVYYRHLPIYSKVYQLPDF